MFFIGIDNVIVTPGILALFAARILRRCCGANRASKPMRRLTQRTKWRGWYLAVPVLKNPKHERFCQELAKGKTADEAYQIAGFKENRGNATRLKANESISDRVAELQERSAARVELTVSRLTEDLLRIAGKGEALAEAPGLSVARGAIMDAAKLNGLVVERKEVGQPGEFDDLNAHELRARLIREATELGARDIAASLSGREGGAGSKPH